jgi:hypothetical protein
MILATTPEENIEFSAQVGYSPTANFRGIKLEVGGKLIALAGYDHWTPNAVQGHIWIKDKAAFVNRAFLRETMRYPFEIGKRSLLVGFTPANNGPALEYTQRIGFKVKYRIVDGWDVGVDMIIQEMRREDCRWSWK